MRGFKINNDYWRVRYVYPDNDILVDRTGERRIAVTDPQTMTVYLSSGMPDYMRARVLIHEMGHCVIYSYDLFEDIHRMVKRRYWIKAEEWICNFIADYGYLIFKAVKSVLGEKALYYIPQVLDNLAA